MGSTLSKPDAQFTRHFKDLDLLELEAAADAVRALLASPGWAVVQRVLGDEVALIDRLLDSDRPLESRADYAAKHGRRSGLRASLEIATALVSYAESKLQEQRDKHEPAAEPVGVR